MSATDSRIIEWKRVYQLVSGTYYDDNLEGVQIRLLNLQNEIQNGIQIFKKPKSNANEELEKLLKEHEWDHLIPFSHKLHKFLDLDGKQTFDLLCHYLMHEYRGSASSLQTFISNESLMIKLLHDIWIFYSLERMSLLKVIKCVVENHDMHDHPYQPAYKELVDKIGMAKLRESFINQFEMLVKDVDHAKHMQGDIFNSSQKLQSWSERKYREINEILQIIIFTIHFDSIEPSEFEKLLDLCKIHAFGKQNQYLNHANPQHNELIQKVSYSEIATIVVALTRYSLESTQWMNDIIERNDDKIIALHHHTEHGPILLTWMLLKFASKKNDSSMDLHSSYGKLGTKAVQLNVFNYLYKMVTHKQFNDKSLVSKILFRCIYNDLEFLCELFNADGSMAKHPMIFDLFAELLTQPTIAKKFYKSEESHLRTLFNSAVQMFPNEFTQLSKLANSLAGAQMSSFRWVLKFLQNLPIYAEKPNDPLYELRRDDMSDDDETYLLLNSYQPFPKIPEFVLPVDNPAIVRGEKGASVVYFLTNLNYFHALHHEINEFLKCVDSFSEIKENRLKRLESGINLLATVIKSLGNPNEITIEMVHPTEMVFDILEKFKVFQHPSLDLMAACVDVCTELRSSFSEEIASRFVNLNIAPRVTSIHTDFKSYSNGNGYELGLVGYYLINIERSAGRYKFLKAYFGFLKKSFEKRDADVYAIELPGLLFIIREVFNNIHSWHFENEQEKMEMMIFVFEYIHEVLNIPVEIIKEDETKRLLRNICVYSLLYLDNSAALLRFVAVGNAGLQAFMENESDWFTASESSLNLLVLLAMKILMQALRLKGSIVQNIEVLSPLEQMIYTQPKQRDTLKIIPIVANYMSHPFNRRFSVLSCRLLRRFAIEFQSSLTACLDLEPDHIRSMFLEPLKDVLENDDLKISILDFVNACIDKQPGLTEAFFKVSYDQTIRNTFFLKKSRESESMNDGIITYMEEFLETVEKEPAKITNDQLKRMMNLFHALWKQGLQSLVNNLVKKPNFWPSLCCPILAVPMASYQYSQLLNILGIEIFKLREKSDENESFRNTIEKFLSKDIFVKWLNIVFDLPTLKLNDSSFVDDTPEWLGRVQSFKDFLVLLLKKKTFIKLPSDSCKLLLDKALQGLVKAAEEMENGNDLRPFVVISELFLIVLNDQNLKYTRNNQEDLELLKNVETLLKVTSNCYEDAHKRSKDSILAIAIKVLDLQANEIKNYPAIASSFVRYNLEIICNEFFMLENHIKNSETKNNATSIILSINMLKKILLIGDDFYGNCDYWFNYYKIYNRILNVANIICQEADKSQITAELFDLLIVLAKSRYSANIVHADVGDYLWVKLTTPRNLSESGWTAKDWWNIYQKGIELVKILLEKEKFNFIKDALFFMGIHEQHLAEALDLARYSLEPNARLLIKVALEFLGEILAYERFWSCDYQMSVHNLMRNVQNLLEFSVSLLQRPKILKRLTEPSKRQLEEYSDKILSDPSKDFVAAINDLVEVITLCTKCLLHFSPKLINLLCDVEFNQSNFTPFIEVQFGAPKLNSSCAPQLSYGTVLSAVALLTKALNLQNFAFKQFMLNNIPMSEEEQEEGGDTVSMLSVGDTTHLKALNNSTLTSPQSPRRTFTKSLSVSSITSTVIQPSNELLSHLDTKICLTALEFLLTLLASQSLLALKARNLSSREKQLIRRELSTELHCLHDLVRKKILKDATKSPLMRQKMGMYVITNDVGDDELQNQPGLSKNAAQRRSLDLRVNVIRKQHLQHKFELPFSPIQHPSGVSDQGPIESTPVRSNIQPSTSTSVKRVGFDLSSIPSSKYAIQEDEEPFAVNRGDPSFTGLSLVRFIEEDYFQLLSNIFTFICQNEN